MTGLPLSCAMSNTEAARALEIDLVTVKARVRRARLYLRARLSE